MTIEVSARCPKWRDCQGGNCSPNKSNAKTATPPTSYLQNVFQGFRVLAIHIWLYFHFSTIGAQKKSRINLRINHPDAEAVGLTTNHKPNLTESLMSINFRQDMLREKVKFS